MYNDGVTTGVWASVNVAGRNPGALYYLWQVVGFLPRPLPVSVLSPVFP